MENSNDDSIMLFKSQQMMMLHKSFIGSLISINTIIEYFVMFIRSVEEIFSLLQPTPSSSSTISNPILRSPTKLYYGGLDRRVDITDSPYGYGL